MEKITMPILETVQSSDCAASSSKSFGSLIQIESIAVELKTVLEKMEMPIFEHFSMRGYVSGMRKKDPVRCMPFALDNLAPLSSPDFRWWRCSHCVPKIFTSKTTEDNTNNADAGVQLHTDGSKEASLAALCDSEKDSQIRDEAITDSSKHGEVFEDILKENYQSDFPTSCPCQKEGHDSTSFDEEAADPSAHIIQVVPCEIQERQTHTSGAFESNETDVKGLNTLGISEGYRGIEVEIQDKVGDSAVSVELSPAEVEEKENVNNTSEFPPEEVEEEEHVSSGNENTSSGVQHKRRPKLRYLNEIMEEEKSVREHLMETHASSGRPSLTSRCHQHLSEDVGMIGSFQKKRRTSNKEGRTLDTTNKTSAPKKLMADGEKTCGREGNFESRPEVGTSAELFLQLEKNAQHIRPSKSKGLDVNKRKFHNENRKSPSGKAPDTNAMEFAGLQRCQASRDINFSQSVKVSDALKQVGTDSRRLQSGQKTERSSTLSKKKRIDKNTLMPPTTWKSGEYSFKGNPEMDLLTSGFIVPERTDNNESSFMEQRFIQEGGVQKKGLTLDLNETYLDETAATEERNHLTTSDNNWDVYAACISEIAAKQQGPGVSWPPTSRNADETMTDDIPMEIVELLANNLHERTTKGSIIWNSPFVDIRRNGSTIASKNTSISENNQTYFDPLNKREQGTDRLEEKQSFLPFSQTQQSRSTIPLSDFIIERSGEGPDLVGPSSLERLSGSAIKPPFPKKYHEGRTISDIRSGEEKLAIFGTHVKQGKIGQSQKPMVGSSEHYHKETIPAMELLSLMDQGLISSSGLNLKASTVHSAGESSRRNCSYFQGQTSSRTREQQSSLFAMLPDQSHRDEGPSMPTNVESSRNLISYWAQGRRTEVCIVNRNPADFSIPHARNEYMISAKDLQVRKWNRLNGIAHPYCPDGHKRLKVGNAKTGKARK